MRKNTRINRGRRTDSKIIKVDNKELCNRVQSLRRKDPDDDLEGVVGEPPLAFDCAIACARNPFGALATFGCNDDRCTNGSDGTAGATNAGSVRTRGVLSVMLNSIESVGCPLRSSLAPKGGLLAKLRSLPPEGGELVNSIDPTLLRRPI